MSDIQVDSHDEDVAILPLIDNLSMSPTSSSIDNFLNNESDCNSRPVGMDNFKSTKLKQMLTEKKRKLEEQHRHLIAKNRAKKYKKKSLLNLDLNSTERTTLAFRRWQKAIIKLKKQKDPWSEFHLEEMPTENVIRHRYNPVRKEWKMDACVVKMDSKQFASGAMRACFRLKKLSNFSHDKSWLNASNYVAKCYKDETIPKERYFEDVRVQMDSKLWAEIYNQHNPPKKIDMFQMCILEFRERPTPAFYHLEHFIEGDYVKYNSNAGFVEDAHLRHTPHAFSHFTFERSCHQLMVVDIQGVDDLYTDPQIHTADGQDYGDGNLGTKGFALFFYSHICNDICRSLGLTEFDLAPSELKSHEKIIVTMKKCRRTKSKGHEEPIFNHNCSARTKYLLNRYNSLSSGENSYSNGTRISEGSEEHLSTHSSSAALNELNSSSLAANILSTSFSNGNSILPLNRLWGSRIRTESEISIDTSMADSPFENEDAFKFIHSKAFNRPRPSAVLAEKACILNADTEFHRNSLPFLNVYESVLGKTHLDMCKYHESGRFLSGEHDDEKFDQEAAFFHLEQAANLGVTEALSNVAKIYLQMPHDILTDYHVEENDENSAIGFEYMLEAAEKSDKNAIYYVAKAFDTGNGLSTHESVDWSKAVEYYRKLLSEEETDKSETNGNSSLYEDSITSELEARHIILARIAQLYMEGGNNLEQNYQEASDLFNEAAEQATMSGKGRLANKYYMQAEEALANVDDG